MLLNKEGYKLVLSSRQVTRHGLFLGSSKSQSQSLGLFTAQIVIRTMFGII